MIQFLCVCRCALSRKIFEKNILCIFYKIKLVLPQDDFSIDATNIDQTLRVVNILKLQLLYTLCVVWFCGNSTLIVVHESNIFTTFSVKCNHIAKSNDYVQHFCMWNCMNCQLHSEIWSVMFSAIWILIITTFTTDCDMLTFYAKKGHCV